MNRPLAGYKNLRPLPEAFGSTAYRGISTTDEVPVLLVEYPMGTDSSSRADRCGPLALQWESLSPEHPVLAQPLRWFFDGLNFTMVFRDPGGPLLLDLIDSPGGLFSWEKHLFPFLAQWEHLENDGFTWTSLDLRRMILGPRGPLSFDLLHLSGPRREPETWAPPFASDDDLLWIAPELTRRTSWPVDLRTGLYSFGIFFYRVATGTWPLKKADPLEMVHTLLNQAPNLGHPKLRILGTGFQAILKKLLQKDPKDRYQTLRGLRWDLGRRTLAPDYPFALGTRDRLLPVAETEKTYGRRLEKEYLAEVADRVASGKSAALVFRGAQGLGKTRLVEVLKPLVEAEGILWLPGKFDQFNPQFSSGGVAQALKVWVESLGSLEKGLLGTLTESIRTDLGRNLRLATNLLPDLVPYVGLGPELAAVDQEDQQKKFLAALGALFRSIASVRPLVLALEDLHWADILSLRFLEELVESLPSGAALVGTCRVLRTNAAAGLLDRIVLGPGPGPGVVDLAPLGENDVFELLGDCTELGPEDRAQLARILVRHSTGNPFNLKILLREVNVRQAAVFDEDDGRWKLQAGKLRNLPFDGASDLVLDRVRALGPAVQQALLVSSLLGVQFSREELVAAGPLPPELFELLAEEFLDLGIWEGVGDGEYRFTHDKLQQAVFEMSEEPARTSAHLRIGRTRLARWRQGVKVSPASVTAHLNFAPGALDEGEKFELVDLNILAGDDLWMSGDPRGGLAFYRAAIDLGGPQVWTRDPDKAWKLYKSAAETAFIEGLKDLGNLWCEEAATRCRFPVQRAQIRERQQAYLFYSGDPQGAFRAGIRGLQDLGIRIPEQPGSALVQVRWLRLQVALRGRHPGTLGLGPRNNDFRSRTILLLLAGLIPPTFLSGRTNHFVLAVLMAVQITLKDGICPESAPAFTGYAVLSALRGDYQGARDFGQLALDLDGHSGDTSWKAMVLTLTALFSFCWFDPLDKLKLRFDAARKASYEVGDFLYRSYDLLFSVLWNLGEDLSTRILKTEEALGLIEKSRYPLTRTSAAYVLGGLRLLGSTVPGPLTFAFPGFDPEEALAQSRRDEAQSTLAICYATVLETSFLLGDLDRARKSLNQLQALKPVVTGSFYEVEITLYSGLVQADLAREARGRGPIKSLAGLVRRARIWAGWNPSLAFQAELLSAELEDLRNHVLRAQVHFSRSIEAADRTGNSTFMALSRERAARFHQRRDLPVPARYLFEESLAHWRRYGAWAKVSLLEAESGLGPSGSPGPQTSDEGVWDIDGMALVRALDAISAEIRIDKLVRSVSKLILENSGADRIAFFVVRDDGIFLEEESNHEGVLPGARRPLDEASDLPRSFLRKAASDRVPLVRETLTEADLRKEPVLAVRRVQSLICLPLVSQNNLKALVYLENKVSPGILTKERIGTIERLSSTIGIALQNAQLFEQVRAANESLERRVEDRTRELQASQKRIVLQEKLASLGALTAGIAHELKNPLNIITNFAESSMELIGELEVVFGTVRDSLPPNARKDLDYLVPELVQNMRDLRVQGQRGDAIIRSMLMHSRSDAGVRTLEDLVTLVKESLSLSYHGIRATKKDFRCRTDEHYTPGVPPVRMIRPNLGRVLINLFTNAFQAVLEKQRKNGPDYQAVVSVSVDSFPAEVLLTIEDNGPGIPKEIQDRIFQPFFTTKPPGEGTGLGLSISFEIIQEELGGTLEVESQPGIFTRFLIRIPVAEKE